MLILLGDRRHLKNHYYEQIFMVPVVRIPPKNKRLWPGFYILVRIQDTCWKNLLFNYWLTRIFTAIEDGIEHIEISGITSNLLIY